MRDYNIESDLKQEKFQSLKLVQGDRGNKIKINVYEDGQPVNLTGCSITAKYKRSDGKTVDGTVENISGNSFDAVIDSDITKVVGTLKMLFSIEKDDVKVSTFLLLADVREGLLENTGSSGGSTGGGEVTVDLSNYYKKNETYSKSQIDSQFKDIVNESEWINVKKFNVKGDGITDDTSSLQDALNHGGKLYFEPGIYLVNGELNYKSNTHIRGCMDKTILKAMNPKYTRESDNTNRWVCLAQIGNNIVENSSENISIENIIFDGNSGRTNEAYIKEDYGDSTQGTKLINVTNSKNVLIKNVTVQNNNYLGSSFTSCQNITIENFKSLNCDVGICIFKNEKYSMELKDYVFNNIFIDGHDMSEGISFYNKSYISNIKMNNINILNKEKGTGLLLGTEYEGVYGIKNAQINNVNINNSAIGLSINQYSTGIQLNNLNIENCTRGLLITKNSYSNQINNVNIKNIKTHGIYIGSSASKNTISNILLENCNTLLSDDYVGFLIIKGSNNICNNITALDNSSAKQYLLVCQGDSNDISFNCINKNSGVISVYSNSNKNTINIKADRYIKCIDTNANYSTQITNIFNVNIPEILNKGISTKDINLSDSISNIYYFNVNAAVTFNLENITLFSNNSKIILKISVSNADASLTLSNAGNIKWLEETTLINGNEILSELICINNKWIELNRF